MGGLHLYRGLHKAFGLWDACKVRPQKRSESSGLLIEGVKRAHRLPVGPHTHSVSASYSCYIHHPAYLQKVWEIRE